MKRAREEDGEAGDAVPEETGSPVARPSPSADAPGAIADRREKSVPTADHDPPDPALAVYEGARASVTLTPEFAKGLRAADVHELVTWVLTPGGPNPRWAFVRHKPVVRRVLLILAPGLDEARCAAARLPPIVAAAAARHAQVDFLLKTASWHAGLARGASVAAPDARAERRARRDARRRLRAPAA